MDTRLYSSKRLAYFLISINTLYVLIKVNIQELYSSYFACYYDLSKSYFYFFIYSTLTIIRLIRVILIIFSIVVFKNVRRIRSIRRQQRQQIRSMTKKDFQLRHCLYIHNIVYIIFSILIVVAISYSSTLNPSTLLLIEEAVNYFLSSFGSFLHYIPYCTGIFNIYFNIKSFSRRN